MTAYFFETPLHPKGCAPPSSLIFFGTLGLSSIYLYVSNKKLQ
jgi:hypothetical protein